MEEVTNKAIPRYCWFGLSKTFIEILWVYFRWQGWVICVCIHVYLLCFQSKIRNIKANDQPVDLPVVINCFLGHTMRKRRPPSACDHAGVCVRAMRPCECARSASASSKQSCRCLCPCLTHEREHGTPCDNLSSLTSLCGFCFFLFLKNLWIIWYIFLWCLEFIEIICKSFWKIWYIFMLFPNYITLSNKLHRRNHCKYSNKAV